MVDRSIVMLTFTRPGTSLVDGFDPSDKYAKVSWDNYPQYDGKVKQKNMLPKHQPDYYEPLLTMIDHY